MLSYLSNFSDSFSVLNVFRYQTFRMGGALLTAFFMTLWMGPMIIRWLKSKEGAGQPIRECGPETHLAKKGTVYTIKAYAAKPPQPNFTEKGDNEVD